MGATKLASETTKEKKEKKYLVPISSNTLRAFSMKEHGDRW